MGAAKTKDQFSDMRKPDFAIFRRREIDAERHFQCVLIGDHVVGKRRQGHV